ncbi:MAG TPA: sulfatase, partial [Thermoanaerobaculia bacterium]
ESGWSRNEHDPDGGTFVWSLGEVSVLSFFLAAPRDLQVVVRCAPPEGSPQAMQVDLNEHPLGTVELAPGMRDYEIALPRAALAGGTNRLAFHYRNVSEPSRENGHRRLAVLWDALRFRPVRPGGSEAPRNEEGAAGALYLPFGSGIDYFLDLSTESSLDLAKIETRGAPGGRLDLDVQEEGGKAEGHELTAEGKPRTMELPGSGRRLVRLSLRAVAPAQGADGGIWLAAPVVRAVRAPRPSQEIRTAVARPSSWPRQPNVLLYLVDTLRSGRLGCYGAISPTSPSLDAFARTATLFEHTVAQSSWTRPSVTSVLTGLEPLAHGVHTPDDRLAEEAVTLPELLRDAGYRTAGFSSNPQVSAETGLAQGFRDFELLPGIARSEVVNQHVEKWLDEKKGDPSPFFLYVHTLDPHAPYEPPADLAQRFAPGVPPHAGALEEVKHTYRLRGEERARRMVWFSALYDAEIAANDRSFGELLTSLRQRGLEGSTLVIFVADHGEEFDEHGGFGHGNNLNRETLDIPLVVRWPGETQGRRVAHPAQQVDLLPTVLAAAGMKPPAGLPGIDLFTLAATSAAANWPAHRNVFSHLSAEGAEGMSVVQGDWKLILPLNRKFGPGPELYRRSADPTERTNLATDNEIRTGWLRAQIRLEMLRTQGGHAAQPAPVDEETRKALRALGY